MEQLYKIKRDFVKNDLEPAVTAADDNVESFTYIVTEHSEEFVEIEYFNGYTARVCVSADNCAAIGYEVFKYLKNH